MHRLIVPGLFEPPDSGALPQTPLLDHLVARGEMLREVPVGYEQLLAGCFGIDAGQADVPAGALLANFHSRRVEGQWACVAPVHLHVDRDRLLLSPVDPATVDSSRIVGLLNDHFREDGMQFHAPPESPWLLELETPFVVTTRSIDDVAGRSLDPFMPAGVDAGKLQALMNECQMLLHADGRAGVVNSLWFWGFGGLPPVPGKPLESVCKSLLCKSFLRACDADSAPADASVFVTDSCLEGRRYGDMQRWISGLAETEQRLRELLELRGTQLYLQSDNGFAVRYRSSMRFRFWQSRNFAKLVQSQASHE
jgi:hypothetical protein